MCLSNQAIYLFLHAVDKDNLCELKRLGFWHMFPAVSYFST